MPRVLVSHGLAAVGMSLPWPLLLVLVWDRTQSAALLGLTGAARMLPYVLLSWAAGRVGDAWPRGRVVRATLLTRVLALAAAAAALATDRLTLAVVGCALAVALATPAYPALAAALPDLVTARRTHSDATKATELLVTMEVASFVVGPALGGVMLLPSLRPAVPSAAVALVAVAAAVLGGLDLPSPSALEQQVRHRLLREIRSAGVIGTLVVMSMVNFVVAVVALALVPMAEELWSGSSGTYGIATGVLGFGALAGPLLGGLGAGHVARVRTGLVAMGLALVTVAPTPALVWALLPLALVGAVAVHVEAAATSILQEAVPDAVRASVLGLADTTMVGAALLGSLLGPALVEAAGPRVLLAVVATLAVATAVLLNQRHRLPLADRIG
ncbi:MAG: MFS transporter [Nocardioidaceae bacterium]